jgi:16S rRNA (uracil1498-N3)-methyltransferase
MVTIPLTPDDSVEEFAIARALRRFFTDSLPPAGAAFTLRGDEAHHMLNVVRVRVGEEVSLFDGSGAVACARLLQGRRGEAALQVLSVERVDVEAPRKLTIACALPRATRMDFLVEKCCELGVSRFVPMVARRSVADPLGRQENHLVRWRRIALEASKQCGRARLMEITAVLPFESALLTREPADGRMIASPAPGGLGLAEFAAGLQPAQGVTAFVGPEGGFTPEEVDLAARAGCAAVSLGPRILRVETAAVALAACLLLR